MEMINCHICHKKAAGHQRCSPDQCIPDKTARGGFNIAQAEFAVRLGLRNKRELPGLYAQHFAIRK